jgi:hypothetical protein
MTLRLIYLLFCQVMRRLALLARSSAAKDAELPGRGATVNRLRAGCALSTIGRGVSPDPGRSPCMALKKQATGKRWRSKEAKEIVAAVQRAGGQAGRRSVRQAGI